MGPEHKAARSNASYVQKIRENIGGISVLGRMVHEMKKTNTIIKRQRALRNSREKVCKEDMVIMGQ